MADAGNQQVCEGTPQRAAVTPRVRTSPGSGALPLERVVQGFLDAGASGVIFVHAPAGGGKTTALKHLRCALPGQALRLHLIDGPRLVDLQRYAGKLLVMTGPARARHDWLTALELVPWAEDEWIEYLAATRRPMVASVMARLKDDATRHALDGSPQLWTIVLDAMAADESLKTARDALRRHLLATITTPQLRLCACAAAAIALGERRSSPPPRAELTEAVETLFRHHVIRLLLAADWIGMSLASRTVPPALLAEPVEPDLLEEIGAVLRADEAARTRLLDLLRERNRTWDAAAASLLLAADPNWRPRSLAARLLRRARLDGARWSGIDLRDGCLSGASLRAACLLNAKLDFAKLTDADCRRADLADASMRSVAAQDADFTGASLRGCDADGADFSLARVEGADLESARLNNCDFHAANLARANLRGAWLPGAKFQQTILDETDLSGVALGGAKFNGVDFRTAVLAGTSFEGAWLQGCNFEGLELREANFQHARLGASLFTGSCLPRANFNGASLINTGLAEIDWPAADLRNADLTGASFHMGSSRSGLVGSPIACEGSRTGFYTDDYNDQDFKAPEEIRKANLCGADLRGAKVDKVDFYLVDVRGAKYTPEQADHFARCGAILRSRVA